MPIDFTNFRLPTRISFAFLLLVLTISPSFSSQTLGRFSIKSESYFQMEDNGDLYRIEDGVRQRWALPSAAKLLEIEVVAEGTPEAREYVAVGITEEGALYRGDSKSREWSVVAQLPGTGFGLLAGKTEMLGVDPLNPGPMFWANRRSVWMSRDNGHEWSLIGSLPLDAERLVLTPDGRLVIFMISGLVAEGAVRSGDPQSAWNFEVFPLPVSASQNTVALYGSHYAIGGVAGVPQLWHWDPAIHGLLLDVKDPSGDMKEYSTRNLTSGVNCPFSIYRFRFDPAGKERLEGQPGTWVSDNYWDFDFNPIRIPLDFRASSNLCVWHAPFDAHRLRITDHNRSTVQMDGYRGIYDLVADRNDDTVAVIRAFGLNIYDSDYYKELPKGVLSKPAATDKWAIVVQNSRNGGTACNALRYNPTPSEAKGRVSLDIAVSGSNAGCPLPSTKSIACLSDPSTSTAARRLAVRSSSLQSSILRPLSQAGLGECSMGPVD